jgi:hypothetical protein
MNENQALDSTNLIEELNLRKEKLAEIDKSIEEQKSKIEFAEAIKRLKSNPDYQLVIENGYFKEEGDRLTKNLLEPTYLKRDQIENIVEMTSAIRHVKTFLMFKEDDGANAEKNIEDLEEYRLTVNSNDGE